MKDGHLNKCIDCAVKDACAYQRQNLSKIRAHRNKPEVRAKLVKTKRAWEKKNPEKVKAWKLIDNAIRRRKLKRMPCDVCGSRKAQAHHEDYARPLDVKWLCSLHHGLEHRR